jgi:hypothetical protein
MSGNSYLPTSIEKDDADHVKLPQVAIGSAAAVASGLKVGTHVKEIMPLYSPIIEEGIDLLYGISPSTPSNYRQNKYFIIKEIYDRLNN